MKLEQAKKLIDKNRAAYNIIVKKFSDTRKYLWSELYFFNKYVASGDSVLDAGCGNGRLLQMLEQKNISYTGIDISPRLVAIAKAQHPNQTFLAGDITNLPFPDNKFNAVFCIATLHHIPGKELREKTIKEFHRVLKKGGCLLMTNWNLWQPRWWPLHSFFMVKKLIGLNRLDWFDILKPWKNETGAVVAERYLHAYTQAGLRKLLEKNGFQIARQYYTAKKTRSNWYSGYNLITVAEKP
ncbi:MAG: class I SAM-dependent methyltransferase [Patescibacteria group bacterium]|jgi:ubiquinone/menaquinone biosynthesis C-methylase UbiE